MGSIRHAELAVRQAENGVLDAAPAQLELQGLTGRLAAQQQQLASTRQAQEMQEAVSLVQAQQRERQQRAAVDLKHRIDEAQAGLADKAEVHQTRAQQQADMHAREFNALLESGQNPYAVFRQQAESVKIAQQQQHHAAKVKAKEAVITSQLQAEEQAHQRAVAARKAVQQVEAQFAKETGAEAREKRIDRFMRSHTVGHQSILDPTGSLPVYPSQATLVKDWSFGMGTGTASAELIAKYQQLNPDVEPNQILLPRRLRQLDPVAPAAALPHTSQGTASTPGGAPVASQERLASSQGPAGASPAQDPDALGQEAGGPYQPKLSKHEKQLMQQAHERHKANITTKQVVMGREFEGEAFKPTPAVVVFKDFEVGQTYRQVITLTNTSLARNAFKVLDLPADICDTVELQYRPPGHISAGLTCQITIMFTPKVNEDIQSSIPLLSETGPIGIPVSCLIKRAVLTVMPQELLVGPSGGVVLGEHGQAAFTILNEGALQVQFEISSGGQKVPALPAGSSRKRANDGASEQNEQLQLGSLVVNSKQGMVQGYSSTQIKVVFTPAVQGPVREQISIAFRALTDKKVALAPAVVTLTGIGKAVPVYTDSELIDFKCCFMGQVYRHAMRIHNRGSSAMKATLSLPPSVHPFLQAQPTTGFCQTGDSFEFALRLCGHASIWESCSKFQVDKEAGILQFPVKVTVAGQVLPVLASIRLQLTSTRISFHPSRLDFGECNLGEKTGVTVQVTNHSTLPQKYGFGRLPKGVSISPGDGYGMLLPLETISLTFSFMPSLTGPYNFQLECQTPLNTKFSLPCTAMARLPMITLSHNRIQAEAQQEAWSRCCHWHIPCYLKPRLAPPQPPSPVTSAQGVSRQPQSPSRQNTSTSSQSQQQQPQQLLPADILGNQVAVPHVIHLDVSTCAVLPDLALEGEGASWQPDRGLWEVDFGSSAVGQRVVKQLRVTSSSPSHLPLFADLLSPQRTFTVMNAVRPLAPQGQSILLLDFTPQECQAFEEVLTVRCPKFRLRIKLKGEGISPAFKVTPEDVTAKGMDMGDVLKGEAAEKVITITNTGTFTSSYRAVVLPVDSSAHPAPFTKQASFTCAPQEGTLAPGASQKITVNFVPEVAFPYYAAKFQLMVPGMQESNWTMQGRAWDEGGVIVGPEYRTPLANPFRPPALLPAIASKGAQPATAAAPPPIAVDANPDLQLSVAMPRSVSPGFKVDSLKLAVPAGERKPLTITFSAPQQPKPGSPAALGLSEEVTGTLTGTLKGGVPPPKTAASRRIVLNLSCQLCKH
ncbi:MAG: flagellar associated [Trebouxia sp. A1-2]|nr:MAG: flagellar associated [Trebouxia sp. A1-2]